MTARIVVTDAVQGLNRLDTESVQCVVTSPPYWGLRDYGVPGQLGLEATPAEYVERMVAVFAAVHRVLREDGVLWLNLGDCYLGGGGYAPNAPSNEKRNADNGAASWGKLRPSNADRRAARKGNARATVPDGWKPKDLAGIPWLTAFALRDWGWYLRADVIWSKPNPMPESTIDRPTKAHEYLFMLTKAPRYYYDAAAIAEPCVYGDHDRNGVPDTPDVQAPGQKVQAGITRLRRSGNKERKPAWARGVPVADNGTTNGAVAGSVPWEGATRNKRSVWTIATQPFAEAHFATFPPKLVEPCVLATSRRGDLVLDPFAGAGTVGLVCDRLGREFVGFELNPEYAEMARRRIESDAPLLADVHVTREDQQHGD